MNTSRLKESGMFGKKTPSKKEDILAKLQWRSWL